VGSQTLRASYKDEAGQWLVVRTGRPDKVWPTCVECQIEETDVGDIFLVGGIRGIQAQHGDGLFGQGIGSKGWSGSGLGSGVQRDEPAPEPTGGRKLKDGNYKNLDEWNVVEVIWQGDRAAHIVNGRTVNAISMLQQPDPQNQGRFIPLTRGEDNHRNRIRGNLVQTNRSEIPRLISSCPDMVVRPRLRKSSL
jgi:hypothetical protein